MDFYIVYSEETKEYLESLHLWSDNVYNVTSSPEWENAFRFKDYVAAIYGRALWRYMFSENKSEPMTIKQVVIKDI